MLNVSETYIVAIDISNKDKSMLTVGKYNYTRKQMTIINTIVGEEAEMLYEKTHK